MTGEGKKRKGYKELMAAFAGTICTYIYFRLWDGGIVLGERYVRTEGEAVAQILKHAKRRQNVEASERDYSNNWWLLIITDNIFIFNAILLVFLNTEMTHLINVIGSI